MNRAKIASKGISLSSMPAWVRAVIKRRAAPALPVQYTCADGPLEGMEVTLTTVAAPCGDESHVCEAVQISATLPITVRGQCGTYWIVGDGTLEWRPTA